MQTDSACMRSGCAVKYKSSKTETMWTTVAAAPLHLRAGLRFAFCLPHCVAASLPGAGSSAGGNTLAQLSLIRPRGKRARVRSGDTSGREEHGRRTRRAQSRRKGCSRAKPRKPVLAASRGRAATAALRHVMSPGPKRHCLPALSPRHRVKQNTCAPYVLTCWPRTELERSPSSHTPPTFSRAALRKRKCRHSSS